MAATKICRCGDRDSLRQPILRYAVRVWFGALAPRRDGRQWVKTGAQPVEPVYRASAPGHEDQAQIFDDASFYPGGTLFPTGQFVMRKQILNARFFAAKLADRILRPTDLNMRSFIRLC